jgi:hypothetical protein
LTTELGQEKLTLSLIERRKKTGVGRGIIGKEETTETTKSAASARRRRRRRCRILKTVTIQPKETICGFKQGNFSHPRFDDPTQQTNSAAGQ